MTTIIDELQQQINNLQMEIDEVRTYELNYVSRLDVNNTGTGAAIGEIVASGDVKSAGGLSIGSMTTNPGTGDIVATGDIYDVAWVDYSASSTIVGWTTFTTKKIQYKKVGKLIFCMYDIRGASNSTSTTFTLPNNKVNDGAALNFLTRVNDNGGANTVAIGSMSGASNVVTFTPSMTGASNTWTNTGTKNIIGEFWYEVA